MTGDIHYTPVIQTSVYFSATILEKGLLYMIGLKDKLFKSIVDEQCVRHVAAKEMNFSVLYWELEINI